MTTGKDVAAQMLGSGAPWEGPPVPKGRIETPQDWAYRVQLEAYNYMLKKFGRTAPAQDGLYVFGWQMGMGAWGHNLVYGPSVDEALRKIASSFHVPFEDISEFGSLAEWQAQKHAQWSKDMIAARKGEMPEIQGCAGE